jgi:hypothetical protein
MQACYHSVAAQSRGNFDSFIMISFFEINYFRLKISSLFFERVGPFLGSRKAAQAKLEAICTTVNLCKFIGNRKAGSFEILNFDLCRSREFGRIFLDPRYPKF